MTCSQFSCGFTNIDNNLLRPPVPGSGEDGNDDACHRNPEPKWEHVVSSADGRVRHPATTARCNENAPRPHLGTDPGPEVSERSFKPDGCAKDQSGYFLEHSNPSSSTLGADLRSLLEDSSGISYFRQFLVDELRHADVLEFWIACRGFRKFEDRKLRAVAMAIWKKFLYRGSCLLGVCNSTKQAIRDRLKSSARVDVAVFDEAVREVETVLGSDYLPRFLVSKDYSEYLRSKSASASPSNQLSSSAGQISPCSCREENDREFTAATRCCLEPVSACQHQTSCFTTVDR